MARFLSSCSQAQFYSIRGGVLPLLLPFLLPGRPFFPRPRFSLFPVLQIFLHLHFQSLTVFLMDTPSSTDLLLAPLLPRLCPGLLLVDTTLSAGLLALLSCCTTYIQFKGRNQLLRMFLQPLQIKGGNIYYWMRGKSSRVHSYKYRRLLELFPPINLPSRMVPIRPPADQQSCIASHQPERQPLEEVSGGLSLLLASVSG